MKFRCSRRCRAGEGCHESTANEPARKCHLSPALSPRGAEGEESVCERLMAPRRVRGWRLKLPMKRQLIITTEPIDEAALFSRRTQSGGMGAAVYFTGIVRAS